MPQRIMLDRIILLGVISPRKVFLMKRFVNRERELDALEEQYTADGASLVVLYGRRRVGKTTLISEFIKDKKAMYFLANEENETLSMKNFTTDWRGWEVNIMKKDPVELVFVFLSRYKICVSRNKNGSRNNNSLNFRSTTKPVYP